MNPYRNSEGVMHNKLGIIDGEQLRVMEYQLTRLRALELQTAPIPGNFDLDHLKAIHTHLFKDVYDWAGQEREMNISKKSQTEPGWKTVFTDKTAIAELAGRAHAVTRDSNNLKGLDTAAFVDGVTKVYAQWNAVHPFPEGNGRALNTMLVQLAREAGHDIDFRRMPSDLWQDAAEISLQRVNIVSPQQTRAADTSEMKEVFEYITDAQPDKSFNLEPIRANNYEQPDRMAVQAVVMSAVQKDPQWFIDE